MIIFETIYAEENLVDKDKKYNEKTSHSEEEFDTLLEVNDILHEYTLLYQNDVSPVYISPYYEHRTSHIIKSFLTHLDDFSDWKYYEGYWDFSNGKKWWAYLVLDFEKERIINYGGDAQTVFGGIRKKDKWTFKRVSKINFKTSLLYRDRYFRGDDEIPNDYKWDGDEEYQGWLQYRWGDGKNALTYVEPPKPKKIIEEPSEEATEEDLKKYLSNYSGDDSDSDEFEICDLVNDALNEYYSELSEEILKI